MKKYLFCLLIIISGASSVYAEKPKADISFLCFDLKYNPQDGVKICEMQQGIISGFYSFFDQENYIITPIGDVFCDFVEIYADEFWVVNKKVCTNFYDGLENKYNTKNNWHYHESSKSLAYDQSLLSKKSKKADNPYLISDYHGLVIKADTRDFSTEKFHKLFPSILILNEAFYSEHNHEHREDKYYSSLLFTGDKILEKLKPQWQLYSKKYSLELTEEILNEFSSEMLVIKPRNGGCGCGIIIITRDELDQTLRYIFTNTENLINNKDPSYNSWYFDKNEDFIIEEYIPSTPVQFAHLGDEGYYDGTMRVGVCLTYDDHEIQFHFLEAFWKVPPFPLVSEVTLNEKHKSLYRRPYLIKIDSKTQLEVERELSEALPILYKKLVAH